MGRDAGESDVHRRDPLDVAAVALALLLTAVAMVMGFRTAFHQEDVDEAVYHRTLVEMRAGKGYYDATDDALQAVYKHRPSQWRSVRPPTLFLLLRWLP